MDFQRVTRVKLLLIFLLAMGLLNSCAPWEKFKTRVSSWKEDTFETIKVYLSSVPVVRRWIRLNPPPKELHRATEEKISQLKLLQVKNLYPEEYERVIKRWEEANRDYQRKFYRRAEKKLKSVQRDAEALLKKVEEVEREKRERALALYQRREEELLSKLPKKEEERLKVRVYLWKLKNLIELRRYEEFEREIERSPL